MKALELRLGNYMTDGEVTLQVTSITESVVYAGALGVNSLGFDVEEYGVPLTEDLLFRFGFKKSKSGVFGGQDQWAGMDAWSINGEWIFRGTPKCLHLVGYFNTTIYYVHQLQNLYFALTGEELTLK